MAQKDLHARRKARIRAKLRTINTGKPRLTVHRTNTNIYAQVIDDVKSVTLAAASTTEKALRAELKTGCNKDAAVKVGKLVAERAKKAGVKDVIFDRSGYIFHGRIKALAEAARENGLSF